MVQLGGGDAPDGDVVRRVLGGDVEAFGVLVHRYRAAFGRYAAAICGDPDLAADAMQEAFVRAYQRLPRCRAPERFGAWFFRILTNQCRNHRVRWPKHERLTREDAAAPAPDQTDGPVMRRELADAVSRALARLTPEHREAFVLRHVDGRSYHDMAELTGEREDTLRVRVHRAREQLQVLLEETA